MPAAVHGCPLSPQAQPLLKLAGHEGPVLTACFYTVGSNVMLATGSADKTVLLWDAVDGKLCGKLDGHTVSSRQRKALGPHDR